MLQTSEKMQNCSNTFKPTSSWTTFVVESGAGNIQEDLQSYHPSNGTKWILNSVSSSREGMMVYVKGSAISSTIYYNYMYFESILHLMYASASRSSQLKKYCKSLLISCLSLLQLLFFIKYSLVLILGTSNTFFQCNQKQLR